MSDGEKSLEIFRAIISAREADDRLILKSLLCELFDRAEDYDRPVIYSVPERWLVKLPNC